MVFMVLMERKVTLDHLGILAGVAEVGHLDCQGSEARMAMMANQESGDLLAYLVWMVVQVIRAKKEN